MTTGAGIRKEIAFSRDGKRFAYARGGTVENVWRVPIQEEAPATWAEAEQLTFDSAYIQFFDVSADGERHLLSSDRTGNFELWTVPVAGGDMLQLTTEPTPDWLGRWSPDEQHIALHAYRSGNRDIWIMPSDGGEPEVLSGDDAFFPTWSADGADVYFIRRGRAPRHIWRVSLRDRSERQMTHLAGRVRCDRHVRSRRGRRELHLLHLARGSG